MRKRKEKGTDLVLRFAQDELHRIAQAAVGLGKERHRGFRRRTGGEERTCREAQHLQVIGAKGKTAMLTITTMGEGCESCVIKATIDMFVGLVRWRWSEVFAAVFFFSA